MLATAVVEEGDSGFCSRQDGKDFWNLNGAASPARWTGGVTPLSNHRDDPH
jgi:hypothetical protein